MVYCGRPSRGCQMCRTRRIKCDERRPTCRQCEKSRKECPGYRNEFDLLLRNETQATARRVQRSKVKSSSRKSGHDTTSNESDSPQMVLVSRNPSPSPTVSVYDRAAHHFVSNYVLVPPQGTERGYLEFIIPLITEKEPDPHFKLAFEACALASFGNRVGDGSQLEEEALRKYTEALKMAVNAIRNPVLAKRDSTVVAVLLLGLFESISSRHIGLLAWKSHTEGAIRLVQDRGPEQLKTKQGKDIFVSVRTQYIIHAFSSGQLPSLGTEFWIKGATKDRFGTECQRITLLITEIKTEANRRLAMLHRSPENIAAIKDLMRQCQARDRDLINWSRSLPQYFHCKGVAWESSLPDGDFFKAEVYPGRVDAFEDLWVASLWNTMRCARIALASIIVRSSAWLCAPLDYRTTPEYATCSQTCINLITDIIASIPYQLGWFSKRKDLLQRASLTGYGCGEDDSEKGLAGYFVTWPLSCVLTQDYSSDSQKAWVKGRLNYVATGLGVRYAKMLTQLTIRIPSMLIKRDAMAASGSEDTSSVDFEKILSNRIVAFSSMSISSTSGSIQM